MASPKVLLRVTKTLIVVVMSMLDFFVNQEKFSYGPCIV